MTVVIRVQPSALRNNRATMAPRSHLDFGINWSAWLDGDTIVQSDWATDGLVRIWAGFDGDDPTTGIHRRFTRGRGARPHPRRTQHHPHSRRPRRPPNTAHHHQTNLKGEPVTRWCMTCLSDFCAPGARLCESCTTMRGKAQTMNALDQPETSRMRKVRKPPAELPESLAGMTLADFGVTE